MILRDPYTSFLSYIYLSNNKFSHISSFLNLNAFINIYSNVFLCGSLHKYVLVFELKLGGESTVAGIA